MSPRVRMLALALSGALMAPAAAYGGPLDSFDDIAYWTGAGANRAALVIDFDGDSSAAPALVWGFRWDGEAFGRDMIDAVVAADPRLFVKISNAVESDGGIAGFGYDRNDDGQFEASSVAAFDEHGFAVGAPVDYATPTDVVDRYREGWDETFWHYGVSLGNPWTTGSWFSSRDGASRRQLADGAWDSWAFASDANDPDYYTQIFAANPVIATPPGGHADFDGDGGVTATDFVVWQRGVGLNSALPMDGDANGDGLVGGGDLAVWRTQFAADAVAAAASAVAEPTSLTTCASAMFVLVRFFRQRIRRDS